MTVSNEINALCFLVIFASISASYSTPSKCQLVCLPELPFSGSDVSCTFFSEVNTTDCSDDLFKSNITNITIGNVVLEGYSFIGNSNVFGLNVTFLDIDFNVLQLHYKINQDKVSCHSFNISSQPTVRISQNCIWPDTDVGADMELRYQAYNSKTAVIDKGYYQFRVPNASRIVHGDTSLEDWELFLYIDMSDMLRVQAKWHSPPAHFQVQYYRLQVFYEDDKSTFRVRESHHIPVSTDDGEESFTFETDSLTGRFYFTVQMLHDNCTNSVCFVSESPIITIDFKYKSPLLIAVIGILIMLPGFLYLFHSWRRFGAMPLHKAPVVLLIYKRTMDSHFRAIVALVMYLRKACRIRALIEDFDILSADTQDSSSWYRDAFTRVDAVMVISSPCHTTGDREKAHYNVNPAALRMLADKCNDSTCTLKLFSVLLPYCTQKDIPKEARNLPVFSLPEELNAVLWFIRFGPRTTHFSKIEYFLFQSQISGGTCDYSRYGKFLREALVDADEESGRLRALLT